MTEFWWMWGIYLFFVISALGVITWKTYKKDPFIRIDFDALARFIAFLAVVLMLRACWVSFIDTLSPGALDGYVYKMKNMVDISSTALVFWEDIWFTMPIAWIMKNLYNKGYWWKKISITLIILISALFGIGHLSQGWFVFIAALYPFFVSYNYGKKYGLGTVMLGHMLYDFATLMFLKNLHLIL